MASLLAGALTAGSAAAAEVAAAPPGGVYMDLVSATPTGAPSYRVSTTLESSADGHWVLFNSTSRRVVPGLPDDRCLYQLYVRDRRTDTTTLVSTTSGGEPARNCAGSQSASNRGSAISGDGRTVAFFNQAPNLGRPGVPVNKQILFKDLATGRLDSVPAPLGTGRWARTRAYIGDTMRVSYDARYALVNAAFPGEGDTDTNYLLDRTTGRWQQICALSLSCRSQALSSDGRYAAYTEYTDTDDKAYLFDRVTGSRRLVPPGPAGPGAIFSGDGAPTFSQDGRLLFCTWVLNDPYRATVVAYRVSDLAVVDTIRFPGLIGASAADASGRYLAVTADPRGSVDVDDLVTKAYIYDRRDRSRLLMARNQHGDWTRGDSPATSMTADGRGVTISSNAGGLIPGRPRTDTDYLDAYFAYRRK